MPEAVLTWAPAQAGRISSANMDLDKIITTMADAKCVVAYRVSHPEEKIITARVGQLVQAACISGINRLAVIMDLPLPFFIFTR